MEEKPIRSLAQDVAAGGGDQPSTAVEGVVSEAKNAVSKGKDEIVRQAKDAAGVVRDQAGKLVGRGKEASANKVEGYVGVARRAADDLEGHSPTGARYIREAAAGVEELSSSLREKSIGEIVDAAQDFARRKPVIFFGGAVLTGFAILRFVKSSSATSSSADKATPSSSSDSQGGLPS